MSCPDLECHEKVNKFIKDTEDTLYNPQTGIRETLNKINLCLKSKVSRKTLISFILGVCVIIGVPSTATFLNVWAESKGGRIPALEKKVIDTRERTVRLEEQYKSLNFLIRDLKEQYKTQTDLILKAIKKRNGD